MAEEVEAYNLAPKDQPPRPSYTAELARFLAGVPEPKRAEYRGIFEAAFAACARLFRPEVERVERLTLELQRLQGKLGGALAEVALLREHLDDCRRRAGGWPWSRDN